MKRQGSLATTLLICSLCSKTFNNNKQSTRHFRYCQKKAKDGVSTRRRRSCLACIKAKTRCDMILPSCTRCSKKDYQCLHNSSDLPTGLTLLNLPSDELSSVVHQPDHVETSHKDSPNVSPDSGLIPVCSGLGTSPDDDFGYLFAGDSIDQTLPASVWSNLPSSNSGETFLDHASPQQYLWDQSYGASLVSHIPHFKDRLIIGDYDGIDLSPSLGLLDTKTILARRSIKAGPLGSAISRIYCMTTLRSYPGMLCDKDGLLPPFIHLQSRSSQWQASSGCAKDHATPLPEPLTICCSIMQMYATRSCANIGFIWRTIHAESLRIEHEYRSYDPWNTLASIQAMVIYIILGLLGDNSDYVADEDILIPMLSTTKRMANKYQPPGYIMGWMCTGEIQQDQIPTWEEWALVESRRRTAIILVIIIHIFNIDHGQGLPQCGGFPELSLPCGKALWLATDQATWEAEYRKQYMRNGSPGSSQIILTYRDLLPDLQDQDDPTNLQRNESLSEWIARMDDLGTLVTMAVSTL